MKPLLQVKGVPASIGVGVGPARLAIRGVRALSYRRIADTDVLQEVDRFRRAVLASRDEIERAKDELTRQQGAAYAAIMDVYLLMHADALLIDATAETIANERINADWALGRVVELLKAPLLNDSSSYFRERARDIDHVQEHLLRHLAGERTSAPPSEPVVIIANDITPADAVRMLAPPTIGLVTEVGGGSSHTAILARTFGVPTVVGVGPLVARVAEGDSVIVDGFSGDVTVNPSTTEQEAALVRRRRFVSFLESERRTQAVTGDGVAIEVGANIELPSEIEGAIANGAEGIGLYRTEFMCLDRLAPPTEDEQVELYQSVVRAMNGSSVVFRTFDWRGDKSLRSNPDRERERLWLRTQIRALLRASTEGPLAIMFPMIATLEELIEARTAVTDCHRELADLVAAPPAVPVGMMVELPSAALLADRFAEHADFFAVGTNDLVQYTLGADRYDHRSAHLCSPLEPAVLRLLARTRRAADDRGIPCSMCGDMASDPVGLGLALGLGYRKFSVPASVVPLAHGVIRSVDTSAVEQAANEALDANSASEVRQLLVDRLREPLGKVWREQGLL